MSKMPNAQIFFNATMNNSSNKLSQHVSIWQFHAANHGESWRAEALEFAAFPERALRGPTVWLHSDSWSWDILGAVGGVGRTIFKCYSRLPLMLMCWCWQHWCWQHCSLHRTPPRTRSPGVWRCFKLRQPMRKLLPQGFFCWALLRFWIRFCLFCLVELSCTHCQDFCSNMETTDSVGELVDSCSAFCGNGNIPLLVMPLWPCGILLQPFLFLATSWRHWINMNQYESIMSCPCWVTLR